MLTRFLSFYVLSWAELKLFIAIQNVLNFRINSFVFSGLSRCTNTLPVLKSSFSHCNFVLWLVQVVLEPAERQIYVPGDVRQEKEIIVIYQPYVVE